MANNIIESYKDLQEKIKFENSQIFLGMLESPYPAFRSKAINELAKMKTETPIIKDFLDDSDFSVRFSALKYLEKMGKLELEQTEKLLTDINAVIRKEAVRLYIEQDFEPTERVFVCCSDPDPSVRYQLFTSYIQTFPDETSVIVEKMRNDPYIKIQQLIKALDDISGTLLSPDADSNVKRAALSRYYESSDSITFFNTIKEIYPKSDRQTKTIIIRFFSGLPGDIIKGFLEQKIEEEKDYSLLLELAKVARKACGKDFVPSWMVDKLIKSSDSIMISYGLKLAADKDDMTYVSFCRELLNSIEDSLVIACINYLVYFQDYSLSERIPDFIQSLSSKRISAALKVVKKLKLDQYTYEIAAIAKEKKFPVSIRKNALNILRYFKVKEMWDVPYNILLDSSERGDLKLCALNALLRLNPEKVTDIQ
ncbi:MAG TPA: HEAT repeat domain-containing protein [Petrotogaceae bacterium]|jgi:hypothetical protein|nr:HEAT repeat domain-containing protein [Petrotogaceae bacterium]HNY37632.1 HEAT repeat domain-containing protein [Petrotogaceae bacterium]HPA92435.1 HEAT repeat domain-containing protein [Petrotogaceae bacterium]HPG47534.1 HEAT repeat domain-containing protein [Petrotogaceae bacterium]HPO26778.1 HEAT repeat domain-containing protein [Petrotogaceae bacterium]